MVGSRTAVTLGQRAQAGAKMLYEFLNERLGSNESKSVRTTDSVPFPLIRRSQPNAWAVARMVSPVLLPSSSAFFSSANPVAPRNPICLLQKRHRKCNSASVAFPLPLLGRAGSFQGYSSRASGVFLSK